MQPYPAIGLLITRPCPDTPLFGVAPYPTNIFTLALLLSDHPKPLLIATIPLLWTLIGASAALWLHVPQDWGLLAALLAWLACSRGRGSSWQSH